MDMSGLVLINCCYIPNSNEDILQLVDDDFICIWHIWIFFFFFFFKYLYFNGGKNIFPFIFLGWQDAKKKIHSHQLQGLAKRSKFIGTTLSLN